MDSEFTLALRLRLLKDPANPNGQTSIGYYLRYGEESGFQHIEVYRYVVKVTIIKYNLIKTALAKAYTAIPGN